MISEVLEEEELVSQLRRLWNKIVGGDISTAERNAVFSQMLKLIKQLILLFGSSDIIKEKITTVDSLQLFNFVLPILSYQTIPLDLRNSCGLLAMKIYFTNNNNSLPVQVIQEILDKQGIYKNIEDIGQLAVFHGILCCCTIEQLFDSLTTDKDDIASHILHRIFILVTISSDGNVVILSSRILNHIMLRLNDYVISTKVISTTFYNNYSIQSLICNQILDMIWLLWDHFLDSAKHLARETFILLIKFQQTLDYQQAFSYFTDIGLTLIKEIPKKKFAFNAISFLVPLMGSQMILSSDDYLLVKLVKLLSDPNYATHSANLLESLFIKHRTEIEMADWITFWFSAYFNNFSKEMLLYGFESHLGKLISSDTISFAIDSFTSKSTLSVNEFCLLILTLKVGIKLRLTSNSDIGCKNEDRIFMWKDIILFNYILSALKCFDPTVRTLAFNLLNDYSKSTELYHQQELDAILNYIEKNISSQDAAFRQKFLNCIKKMLYRINKGIATKNKIRMQGNTVNEYLFAIHEDFIKKLFNNIVDNLYCGANFPRRYTSLLILELITETVMSPHTQPFGSFCYLSSHLYNTYLRDSLLICHCDSYENIKKLSYKLLKSVGLLSKQCIDFSAFGICLLESARKMSSSPRPLDSLTSSYILNSLIISENAKAIFKVDVSISLINYELNFVICNCLLDKLQEEICIAEKSLLKAASTAPMYGQILVLRNLFANFDKNMSSQKAMPVLLKNIISACIHISNLVSDIVKNASPEGQLPVNLNFENEDFITALNSSIAAQEKGLINLESFTPLSLDALAKARAISAQMLLLCGWRSIKEISLLFGFIIQHFASLKNTTNVLSYKQIEDIGNFFMTQLIETKHRGAFEQAYSGFLMVCETLWENSDLSLNNLPGVWLKHILNTITDSNDHRLCATRRSAGVPFIIQAILSTEPSVKNGLSLKLTVEMLLKLAACDTNVEPKLHSMNILRALYRDTRLGDAIMPYVTSGVKIAINAYNSGAWNVRNSATLLFSSLVTRMLGVKRSSDDLHSKNSISALIFFKRYPMLYDFFLEKMETSINQMNKGKLVPSTYLVLLLLARFTPLSSEGHSTSIPLTPFIPLILNFCSSSICQLRTLAAKAFIPLLTPLDIKTTFNHLCKNISLKNQNQIHGNLLFVLQILKSYKDALFHSTINNDVIKESLWSIIWVATDSNPCPLTRALAMELFSELDVINILLTRHTEQLTTSCYSLISSLNQKVVQPGSFHLLGNAVKLYLIINIPNFKDETNICLLSKLMNNTCNEVQTAIFDHLQRIDSIPRCLIKNTIVNLKKDFLDMKRSRSQVIFLSTQLSKLSTENAFYSQEIIELLNIILHKWAHEYREDHLSCLIMLSAKIINLIMKSNWEIESQIILKWAEDVTMYSCVENSSVVRTCATEALSLVLEEWNSKDKKMEKAELLILKAVLELFTDDDLNIQNLISKGTFLYLRNKNMDFDVVLSSFNNSQSLSIHDILNYLFLYLARGKTDFLSILLQHSLREDKIEEFGLAQVKEDDRAFEKGETKVNREDIQIAKYAAKAITAAIPFEDMGTLNFNISLISEYLLVPIPEFLVSSEKCYEDEEVNYENCDIVAFLTILKREIEYILDKFSVMKHKDIFAFQHFDIWISRLGCRSLIWMAFKEFANKSKINIDVIYINNIQCSLMKPRIFLNILEWLS